VARVRRAGRKATRGVLSSLPDSVVEVDHAVSEDPLIEQLESLADPVLGEGALARSDDYRDEEQLVLVHQPGPDGVGGELGAAHRQWVTRGRLQPPNRRRVERSLDAGPRAGDGCQGLRVDDLVGRLPDLRELLRGGGSLSKVWRTLACTSSSGAAQSKLPVASSMKPSSEAIAE